MSRTDDFDPAYPPQNGGSAVLRPVPPPLPAKPRIVLAAPARVLIAALGVGGMGAVLFYGQDLGINVLLFVCLMLAALWSLASHENTPVKSKNLWIIVPPLLFFAAMIGIRASGLLTFWNGFAVVVLLLWAAHFWSAETPTQTGFWGFVGGFMKAWGNVSGRIVPTGLQAMENAKQSAPTGSRSAALPLVRGVLLALPILGVFIALLASADLVFAQMVQNVGKWLLPADVNDAMGRFLVGAFIAWGTAGGFAYALTRRDAEANAPLDPNALAAAPRPAFALGFVEAITVLGSVCSVFAAFVAIQFAYLFGGASHVAAVSGLNFATYARRGFWELVAVACLTLILVSCLRTFTRRETTGHITVFNTCGTVLVGLTLVLLASAAKRMALFEAAYGFTELRLYVDVFLFWLAAALAFFVWTLWKNAKTFAFGGLVCACGMLVTLNVLGPDAVVVNRNFARQATLSHDPNWDGFYRFPTPMPDAVPALISKWETLPGGKPRKLLGASLRDCLTNLENQRTAAAWPSWNLSRIRAYQMLKAHEKTLPTQTEADRLIGNASY